MTGTTVRTVWLAHDTKLLLLITAPVWAVAGLAWGASMSYMNGGQLFWWLLFGQVWAVLTGTLCSSILAWTVREITVRLPVDDRAVVIRQLARILKPIGYTIKPEMDGTYVARSHRKLARLFAFRCTALSARIENGEVVLTGPAALVGRVRRKWDVE